MNSRTAVAVLAFCAVLLVAGGAFLLPGGGGSAKPLRIGSNPWPGYQPLFLAEALDLVGPDTVRLSRYGSSLRVLRDLRWGRLDGAALTLDEVLRLTGEGIDLRVVLVMDTSNGGDALVAKSGIDDLKDLSGKRVAVEDSAVGGYFLARALEIAKLDADKVKRVVLPVDQHAAAFEENSVDAAVTFPPWRETLVGLGGHVLFDSSQIPNEIFDVLAVRAEVLDERPDTVRHLLVSWFKALDYWRRKPDPANRRMANGIGMEGADLAKAMEGLRIPDARENERMIEGLAPSLLIAARRLSGFMFDTGLLKEAVDPGFLFEPGVIERIVLDGSVSSTAR